MKIKIIKEIEQLGILPGSIFEILDEDTSKNYYFTDLTTDNPKIQKELAEKMIEEGSAEIIN